MNDNFTYTIVHSQLLISAGMLSVLLLGTPVRSSSVAVNHYYDTSLKSSVSDWFMLRAVISNIMLELTISMAAFIDSFLTYF